MTKAPENLRRQPRQERSRGRVDDILASAKELIGSKGLAAVTMKDIAAASGMPLATVYHYFPNRSSVVAELYQRFALITRQQLGEALMHLGDARSIIPATSRIADDYFQRMRQDPALLDLFNAIQVDKSLQSIDVAETRLQSTMFCEATEVFVAEEYIEDYRRSVYLLFQLAGGTARLALMQEEQEGRLMMQDFKRLIRSQLLLFGIA